MDFYELDLEDEVLDGLDAMNFVETSPIQSETIPPLLEGRDVIGCAQTGSGKTAAYLLPFLNKVARQELPKEHLGAVVMAPTRELAKQIDQEVEGFGYYVSVSTLAIYGGTDGIAWEQQRRGMALGADIVIATPGRLLSMLRLGACDLSHVQYFVLDEADRMLDMGFYEDIMEIYKALPEDCQHVMFSATMPKEILKLSESILVDPVLVELAVAKPPKSIMQTAYICYDAQKLPIIRSLFANPESELSRTIIFAGTKATVHALAQTLTRDGLPVAEMHSDLSQERREEVLRDFRMGRTKVLVATDIVARGIDIDDIGVVINYEVPRDFEDYVHRIGRTARGADGKGLAITLVSPCDQQDFARLEQFLEQEIYRIPLDPSLGEAPTYAPNERNNSRGSSRGRGNGRGRSHGKGHGRGKSQGKGRSSQRKGRSGGRKGSKQ